MDEAETNTTLYGARQTMSGQVVLLGYLYWFAAPGFDVSVIKRALWSQYVLKPSIQLLKEIVVSCDLIIKLKKGLYTI